MPKPLVLIKAAISVDGKIATKTGDSQWISNEKSRAYVHELRHAYDAILVGVETVIKDDPRLTIRRAGCNEECHIRMILDSKGRIPLDAKVLNDSFKEKTWIVTTNQLPQEKEQAIVSKGAHVKKVPALDGRVDFKALMDICEDGGVRSIFIEGGGEVIASALKANIVDLLSVAIAPMLIGGKEAKSFMGGSGVEKVADAILLEKPSYRFLDDDVIIEYRIKKQ